MSYFCYILKSLNPAYTNRTYTGITNNLTKRLRQHNGELSGGARCTKMIQPLNYFILFTSLTKSEALSIERTIHNLKKKHKLYCGLSGSLLLIPYLIEKNLITKDNIIIFD